MEVMSPMQIAPSTSVLPAAGCRSDSHQASHGTRAHTHAGRTAAVDPVDRHPRHSGYGCCQMGDKEGVGIKTISCQTTAGIETEPTQPQHGSTDEHKGDVGGRNRTARTVAGTTAQHQSGNQCGNTGIDMYHRATGKVNGSHLLKETAAPHKVGHGIIDDDRPKNGEQQKSRETHALGKSTDDQRRSDHGKHALEKYECQLRNMRRSQHRVNGHAMEEYLIKTSDHATQGGALKTGTKHPTVTNGYPENAADGSADETLHENAEDVLGSHKAAVEQCQGRHCHKHH